MLLNIKPVYLRLIRLCSFCNNYMLNNTKFFEIPCAFRIDITFSGRQSHLGPELDRKYINSISKRREIICLNAPLK